MISIKKKFLPKNIAGECYETQTETIGLIFLYLGNLNILGLEFLDLNWIISVLVIVLVLLPLYQLPFEE